MSETTRYPNAPGFKEQGGASEAAAKALAPTLKKNQQATLDALERAGKPMTADELAEFAKRSILYIRPRVSELHRLGKLKKTGEYRKNASGAVAAVWMLAPERESA